MRSTFAGLFLALAVWVSPPLAMAQLVVHDPGNAVFNAATAARTLLTATNTAQIYIRQGQQLVAEYNMVLQEIEQLKLMIVNLQRIPEGLNFFDAITVLSNKLTILLGKASTLSFDLDIATGQFNALYRQIGDLTNPQDILALRKRLMTARLDATDMSVQVTAIRTNLIDIFTRVCALLDGSWMAHGALDSAQIAAQQNGLLQNTLATVAAMQATNSRVFAQSEAEKVVIEQVQVQAIQGAMADTKPYTEANGHFPTFRW